MVFARKVVLSIGSMSLLACRMGNPAFDDDDDELGDDATADETGGDSSESDESSESGSSESSESSTLDESTSDESTTENSTVDTSTTSESTSESTDTGETGIECAEGLTLCEGECVDAETDELNCGECGTLCADNELCVGFCSPKKYVFVSSEPTTGAMGGILGADLFCQDLAADAGLPGTYLAWNSTFLSFPDFDFVQEGVYVRTDETIVAMSYEDLTDGDILVPINTDESGVVVMIANPQVNCANVSAPVWSSTKPTGEFAGGDACEDWFSSSNLNFGKIGRANTTDGTWSEVPACDVPCGMMLPIYCVQQTL